MSSPLGYCSICWEWRQSFEWWKFIKSQDKSKGFWDLEMELCINWIHFTLVALWYSWLHLLINLVDFRYIFLTLKHLTSWRVPMLITGVDLITHISSNKSSVDFACSCISISFLSFEDCRKLTINTTRGRRINHGNRRKDVEFETSFIQ